MNHFIPQIDVCIATYKRPGLLRKLLSSLLCQETEGQFSYGIIVSDNDDDRGAYIPEKEEIPGTHAILYGDYVLPSLSLRG